MTTKSPLLDWVARHEFVVSVAQDLINPVSTVAKYGKNDLSIVAQSAIQPGAILVTLKTGAFLNGSNWLDQRNEQFKLQEHFDTLQLSGTMETTLALLAEVARGEKSAFYGYIQQLPTTISLPFNWNEQHKDMLRHTAAFPILDDDLVLKMYSVYVAPLAEKFSTIWPNEVSTLEQFQWAYSIVSSRAFGGIDKSEPTLLPVIDMANHDTENPAAHIVKTDSGSFQLVALREVKKGDCVTISYGDLSNAQLLYRYGFVLPTLLPSDSIRITSFELTDAFTACSQKEGDEHDEEGDVHQVSTNKGATEANPAKRRKKMTQPENNVISSFFLLHGDAEREFGLGDALLSFVMASQLPTEQLYDALVVVLQNKDKQYEDTLKSISKSNADAPLKAIEQLIQHERQICRRIIVGLMSLEEDSDLSDNED